MKASQESASVNRRSTWTRPSLVRLSSSGLAQSGSFSYYYEGQKVTTDFGTGYFCGNAPAPS
jgi:hypothetical protein